MKKIEITLEVRGDITQLPDSQKIFGSLMFLLSKSYGSQKTQKFVEAVNSKRQSFMLSSLLPKGYLPLPKTYLMEGLNHQKDIQTPWTPKEMYSAVKSIDYIPKEILFDLLRKLADFLKNEEVHYFKRLAEGILEMEKNSVKLEYDFQQRVGIDNEMEGLSIFENQLYSTQKIQVMRIEESKKVKQKEFSFLVMIDDQTEDGDCFCKMLERGCEAKELLLLGRRATQGNNIYQMKNYDDEEIDEGSEKTDLYLNLGKLLPDQIEYEKSYLDLFTSERKPYHMATAMNRNVTDQCFISFIKEGSVICKNKKTDDYDMGKSIANPFNEGTIVFGNAYLYPISVGEVAINEEKYS